MYVNNLSWWAGSCVLDNADANRSPRKISSAEVAREIKKRQCFEIASVTCSLWICCYFRALYELRASTKRWCKVRHFTSYTVLKLELHFLPLERSYASAVLAAVILSICPSVTCVFYDKTKQCTVDILIPHEGAVTLVFWHQQWLVTPTSV